MIATFLIEIGLAAWVLWKYRQTMLVKLVVLILVLLAIFQLAEFTICEDLLGLSALTWARIGYVAITALPAIGIHALVSLVGKNRQFRWLVVASYISMGFFMVYFLLVGNGITATECGGNYVLFQTNPTATRWYTLYYYGLELLAIIASLYFARQTTDKRTKQALYGFTGAYLTLIIPVATVNIINRELVRATPSVMCGFAVFLALIIALYVLPRSAEPKS